jgi:hypothetical protein
MVMIDFISDLKKKQLEFDASGLHLRFLTPKERKQHSKAILLPQP